MKGRINNKVLLVVLLVLATAYGLTAWMQSSRQSSDFSGGTVLVDTANVARIILKPRTDNGEAISFERTSEGWTGVRGTILAAIPKRNIESMLNELARVKPSRLAAKSSDKWAQFEVTDSLGTVVEVYDTQNQLVAGLVLGKFSYAQRKGQQAMQMGGRNSVRGISYYRLADSEEVYAADGFLNMTFNRGFTSWRDQRFVETDRTAIQQIDFTFDGERFSLTKGENNSWMCDGAPADSIAVENFLSPFNFRNLTDFNDAFEPSGPPTATVSIAGTGIAPITLQAWRTGEEDFVLHSSQNPRTYFSSTDTGVFADFFARKARFVTALGE